MLCNPLFIWCFSTKGSEKLLEDVFNYIIENNINSKIKYYIKTILLNLLIFHNHNNRAKKLEKHLKPQL